MTVLRYIMLRRRLQIGAGQGSEREDCVSRSITPHQSFEANGGLLKMEQVMEGELAVLVNMFSRY